MDSVCVPYFDYGNKFKAIGGSGPLLANMVWKPVSHGVCATLSLRLGSRLRSFNFFSSPALITRLDISIFSTSFALTSAHTPIYLVISLVRLLPVEQICKSVGTSQHYGSDTYGFSPSHARAVRYYRTEAVLTMPPPTRSLANYSYDYLGGPDS